MDDEWTIETLKVISQSGRKNDECLGVKETPYWNFVEINKFICLILPNQINLGNNFFHNLSDYSNEYIEILSVKQNMARNSFLMVDSSIHEKVKLIEDFDISEQEI